MERLAQHIDRVIVGILVALMAVMVITVSWQVATRYLLNNPSSYTQELATYLLIWISMLGSAYAVRLKAHLGVDVITRKLQGSAERAAHYFIYMMVIAFAVIVFLYGGGRLVYITLALEQLSAALRVPIGYVYMIIPLSGALMVFYSIVAMLESPGEPETAQSAQTS